MSSPSDTPAPFATLADLRAAHSQLLKQRHDDGDSADMLSDAERFILRAQVTGVLLDDNDDRRAAQSLLNFWANTLYRAGFEPPDAALAPFDPNQAPDLDDALCPYLGLDAFREPNHGSFFGRRRLIEEMLDRLTQHRLLAVIGPSGSGKSSLVQAGVLPALKADALPGSQDWCYLAPIVPGSEPLASLDRALRTKNQSGYSGTRNQGPVPEDSSPLLDSPVVLVVDQFEEVFTLCDDAAAREAFIAKLLELVRTPAPRHIVILTLRSDYEPFITRVPELQPLFEQAAVRVTPLGAGELREAVEKPAEMVGLKFEAGVVDALLQDILGEPAALPLLQFTLLKLWEHRDHNRVTLAAYRQVGGGRLALARSADAFYERLIPEDQIAAKRILLRMVRPGEGLEVTSNRIRKDLLYRASEAPDRIDRVLGKLIEARLVRLTPGDTPADDQVEVAHEALVRNWPRLVDWLEEEKAAITTRRRLEAKAAEWVRLGQASAGMLDEVQLLEAERWLASPEAAYLGYDPSLPALVEASRAAIDTTKRETEAARQRELDQAHALAEEQGRRAEEQARLARRLRRLAVGLLIVIVLAAGLAVVAVWQRNLAVAAQAESEAISRSTTALFELNSRPEQALLLALASIPSDAATDQPAVYRSLYRIFEDALIRRSLVGHSGPVAGVTWSPDGQYALTGSHDGTARIWNVAAGTTVRTLVGHNGTIVAVAWSPDGNQVLTGSSDGTARIWDAATGAEVRTLTGHRTWLSSVAWSPDGSQVLTGGGDGTARIWDAATGAEVRRLEGRTAIVRSVAWSPDGNQVLTGDSTAHVWDAATGAELRTLKGHVGVVTSASWSPDSNQILTTGNDATARVWDAATGAELRTLKGHLGWIWSATWSPDGRQALTAGFDGTARIWDVSTGVEMRTLKGHTAKVWSVAWRADGRKILTGSDDTTARVWDAATGFTVRALNRPGVSVRSIVPTLDARQVATISDDGAVDLWDVAAATQLQTLEGDTSGVGAVAWTWDGRMLATGEADGELRIWDARTGAEVRAIEGHTAAVTLVAWGPDGRQLLANSADGTMRIWDATSGAELHRLATPSSMVSAVGWSTDGRHLATGQRDGMVRVWDVATGASVLQLEGHTSRVWSIWWSPDSQRLATGSDDGTARIWDAATGTETLKLAGHTAGVLPVSWSPDGRQLVTGGDDGTARIWDIATGEQIRVIDGFSSVVSYAAWSLDGRQLMTLNAPATAQIWLVDRDLIIADITGRVCALFSDAQIRAEIPSWRGCNTMLAAVADDLRAYDQLQGDN